MKAHTAAVTKVTAEKITYRWKESYAQFRHEARPLIERHWDEVGSHRDILRCDIDHDRYVFLEKSGIFHLLTARNDAGSLIGYFGVSIIQHPRDRKAILGVDEFIYAMPEYRRCLIGPAMITRAIDYLDRLGCHIIAFREKAWRNGGGYLHRWGFEPAEMVYTKVLRAPHQDETL